MIHEDGDFILVCCVGRATPIRYGKSGYINACLSESPDTLLYEQDSASFYTVFPKILRSFYNRDSDDLYINKSIANLALNCPIFNTHRMAAEYVSRYDLQLTAAVSKKIEKLQKIYQSDR